MPKYSKVHNLHPYFRGRQPLHVRLALPLLLVSFGLIAVGFGMSLPSFAQSAGVIYPENFGAKGDGSSDDGAAIQNALNSLKKDQTLQFRSGKTYRHTNVLRVNVSNVRITGPGVLYATNEGSSGFVVHGSYVTIDGGLSLKMGTTTKRWSAPEQHKLTLYGSTGSTIKNVTIDGSAAAGILVYNSSNYLIEDVYVRNTRADGIHSTGGSYNGVIKRPTLRNVADDGVAVVSYGADGKPTHHIYVESPRFYGNEWGRAFTVVGGHDITFTDIYAENSNAASIYVATEGNPFFTESVRRVKFSGGTIIGANVNHAKVDHGAIMLMSGRSGYSVDDVLIENLTVRDTRAPYGQIRFVQYGGGFNRDIVRNITLQNGGSALHTNANSAGSYNLTNVSLAGKPVANITGHNQTPASPEIPSNYRAGTTPSNPVTPPPTTPAPPVSGGSSGGSAAPKPGNGSSTTPPNTANPSGGQGPTSPQTTQGSGSSNQGSAAPTQKSGPAAILDSIFGTNQAPSTQANGNSPISADEQSFFGRVMGAIQNPTPAMIIFGLAAVPVIVLIVLVIAWRLSQRGVNKFHHVS